MYLSTSLIWLDYLFLIYLDIEKVHGTNIKENSGLAMQHYLPILSTRKFACWPIGSATSYLNIAMHQWFKYIHNIYEYYIRYVAATGRMYIISMHI